MLKLNNDFHSIVAGVRRYCVFKERVIIVTSYSSFFSSGQSSLNLASEVFSRFTVPFLGFNLRFDRD